MTQLVMSVSIKLVRFHNKVSGKVNSLKFSALGSVVELPV